MIPTKFLLVAWPVLASLFVAVRADALPRSTPERQGVDSGAILRLVNALNEKVDSLHSLVIVRHGNVIAEGWWEPYTAHAPHELYSLSKSFTSTAVGLAVAEGKLSIDGTVISFFPDETPERPSANLKAMRVRDLLCMSTGHEKEISAAKDSVSAKAFLAHPVPFKPGTHFLYNTPATFMLSAIVQKVTGQTVLDYLRPRLFEPLGIEHPTWETNHQGICLGGYGLSVRTEDIAKFGQLYLQRGKWNGKQLLPAAWVEMATARQTSNGSNPKSDWDQGYGFQFWRCRNGAYRGDGAFGQYCVVMPEQDTVIAITSGLGDMQAVLNQIWEHALPAFRSAELPANEHVHQDLLAKLRSLEIARVKAAAVGLYGKEMVLDPNPERLTGLTLQKGEMVLHTELGDQRLPYGDSSWVKGQAEIGTFPLRLVAGSGAWTAPDTFKAKICLTETPYILTCTLKFDGNKVTLDREFNVFFGPRKLPVLTGHVQ